MLAESNDGIASVVDYLTEAGPYMGLLTVMLPFVLQLAANHGRIDASKLSPEFGVYPPDVLEGRVRSEMEAKRAQMREAAQAAERHASNGAA
jgi:hypothetical protein